MFIFMRFFWQRFIEMLKEWKFYIRKQLKVRTQNHIGETYSQGLSTADFSLSSDEYLEAESGPHGDKNNMFSHL